ncbi:MULTISPECIES: QueT transporter family protein [unclassified Clostridioides]|uniref:QueT transporter family protein n=1 Tax=unclassified Clostridioides TaxID=2635829 RepID=UPI001D0CB1E9|nr:QueT transporter family protein [Clostridioides sp. ES-S-0001-02]MCC0638748.1 QueT transporter family protein [Clostridioides sp. ES-S-0049-03]MCC0652417.1 QueT transporter family protein [Clostridioides sp. ES-S-0001-03]MCC0673488.1 QueT transporter family protein [Clostridioides sp. ES-S-0145-01]MCC0675136.1 QueT transporter family protein [Clostridioides sp. ES-W-0018-02]MCC0679747.1 QueT transporter family protein [Clostridioides sp. ES-S-0005-03]MCC0695115.1 QueT transporter family pr
MRRNSTNIAVTAVVTSIYAVLTLSLGFISYGPIQFRIAEIMMLLAFLDKGYIVGLTLGCFLANVIGPYGVPDIIFGTFATFVSASLVYITRKLGGQNKSTLIIASIWPTIINAIVVGLMLNIFFGLPLILSMIQVGFGEFVVVTLVGVPFFCFLMKKYRNIIDIKF